MALRLRLPTRLELLLVTLICAAINAEFLGRTANRFAFGFCIGSSLAQLGLMVWTSRGSKEEKPSSPNPQPKSGTSQNPSPSSSLDLNLVVKSLTIANPHNSPNTQNQGLFQPETRATPVVGFRSWHIQSKHRLGIGPGWELCSFNRQYGVLARGPNTAVCNAQEMFYMSEKPRFHVAPLAECTCGFYVLTDFDKVPFATEETVTDGRQLITKPSTMMVGAVVGWGRVVQHAGEGWRAQKVQLIALLDCKVSDEHLRITREVAESYGVPVVGRTALELLAKEYGDRLTEVMDTPKAKA